MKHFQTHSVPTPTSFQQHKLDHDLVDAGRISADELALYWRKESTAAAKRMAAQLGVRCVAGKYPWFSIWMAEGLAKPPKTAWKALQQRLLTTDDVAVLLACDARSIRRYALNPPDCFPAPVFENGRPWLWRSSQVHAYVAGHQVPQYRRAVAAHVTQAVPSRITRASDRNKATSPTLFNPFCSS